MTSLNYSKLFKKYARVSTSGIFFFLLVSTGFSQRYSIYENQDFSLIEKHLYQPGNNFHTSVRQYQYNQMNRVINVDSMLYDGIKKPNGKLNFWKRIFHDDLLKWNKTDENLRVVINPLFNFEAGKESVDGTNTFINTRGLFVEGSIGKNFAFYADVLENQGSFPNYVESFIQERKVVPGQGKRKSIATTDSHDYTQATGYISFNAGRYFNFQLGTGKNFIGDGYRSMLLSDVAFSYPYFKFTTDFWKVKYMIMWASMTHLSRYGDATDEPSQDISYPTKYGVFHYLDWNIGKRFSLGLFESVIWSAYETSMESEQDTVTKYRGFDWHYANPFIFFRPVEYSVGSPDNVNIGFNAKYIAANWLTLYGQFMFDEFKFDELSSGNQWWGNKYAYQLGFKTFDLFGLKNLRWQVEYNRARPYTYSHNKVVNNYGHYNQSLAHPLGANFSEFLTIVNYRFKRWQLRGEIMKAKYGKDDVETNNYGGDIFKPNNNGPVINGEIKQYGHVTGQGLSTDLFYAEGSVSYLINPRNNFNIAAGLRLRNETNSQEKNETRFVWFAVRTSLKNLYYDF